MSSHMHTRRTHVCMWMQRLHVDAKVAYIMASTNVAYAEATLIV